MLKSLFGLAPKQEPDGSFRPSKIALKLATSDLSDFEPVTYEPYQGKRRKILVIFTERKNMRMQNGKELDTRLACFLEVVLFQVGKTTFHPPGKGVPRWGRGVFLGIQETLMRGQIEFKIEPR